MHHAGFYGNSQNQTFNESSTSGQDYLAEVCRDWEAAAKKAKTKRTVIIRTGIVLAKEGGAVAKMLPVFNIFAGGPLGTGQQWCSWIHRSVQFLSRLTHTCFESTDCSQIKLRCCLKLNVAFQKVSDAACVQHLCRRSLGTGQHWFSWHQRSMQSLLELMLEAFCRLLTLGRQPFTRILFRFMHT